MHFPILTIVAACSLHITLTWAEPSASPSTGIADTVNYLDSNDMLHWTPAGNGRTTTIPGGLVSFAHDQLKTNRPQKLGARRTPKAAVWKWTVLGVIDGFSASWACIMTGAWGVSKTIAGDASDACNNLVYQASSSVPMAETAWRVWQSAPRPGADGQPVSTTFRYFTHTATAPTLTMSICTQAFDDLTSGLCPGWHAKGGATQGGEIKIGSGENYLMVGFDPNDL